MNKEEKSLLLQDLCAREPYHPRIQVFNQGYEGFQEGEFDTNLWLHHIDAFRFDRIEILPYLRPMSSMTKEEEIEYDATFATIKLADGHYDSTMTYKSFDFLNAQHFDYRGLIPMSLAFEAPKDMYNIK